MGTSGFWEEWWHQSNILLEKSDHEIWMLTLYSKSERASIPGHMLKQIAEAIKHE